MKNHKHGDVFPLIGRLFVMFWEFIIGPGIIIMATKDGPEFFGVSREQFRDAVYMTSYLGTGILYGLYISVRIWRYKNWRVPRYRIKIERIGNAQTE